MHTKEGDDMRDDYDSQYDEYDNDDYHDGIDNYHDNYVIRYKRTLARQCGHRHRRW